MANTKSLDLESSSSQYAYITDANQTGLDITGDFTFEFWFKAESVGINQAILSKFSSASGNYSYRVTITDDNKIAVYLSADGTTSNHDSYESTSAEVTAGVWNHFAIIYEVSENLVTVYKNGKSIAGSTTTTGTVNSIYNGSADFNIGASGAGSEFHLDGKINEVRVWNDMRTVTEIQENLGKILTGSESNLQGYWRLNDDYTDETSNGNDLTASGSPVFASDVPFSGEYNDIKNDGTLATNLVSYYELEDATDSHGSNNGTATNMTYATGKIGNAGDFNGTSSYLELPDSVLTATNSFTVSFWIKADSFPSGHGCALFEKFSGSTSWNYGTPSIGLGSDGTVDCSNRDSSGIISSLTFGDISDNSFHHICMVHDSSVGDYGRVKSFFDGVLISTADNARAFTDYNRVVRMAKSQDSWQGDFFDGLIDETGIWSRALTAGEVSELYNSGNALDYENTGISVDAPLETLTVGTPVPTLAIISGPSVDVPLETITISTPVPASRLSGEWNNETKPTSTWKNNTKTSATWSNESK